MNPLTLLGTFKMRLYVLSQRDLWTVDSFAKRGPFDIYKELVWGHEWISVEVTARVTRFGLEDKE